MSNRSSWVQFRDDIVNRAENRLANEFSEEQVRVKLSSDIFPEFTVFDSSKEKNENPLLKTRVRVVRGADNKVLMDSNPNLKIDPIKTAVVWGGVALGVYGMVKLIKNY